jgi:hypothetical protein
VTWISEGSLKRDGREGYLQREDLRIIKLHADAGDADAQERYGFAMFCDENGRIDVGFKR